MAIFSLPSYLNELKINGVEQSDENDDTQDFSLDTDEDTSNSEQKEDETDNDQNNDDYTIQDNIESPDAEKVDLSDNTDDDDYTIPDEPEDSDNNEESNPQEDNQEPETDPNAEKVDLSDNPEQDQSDGKDPQQDNQDDDNYDISMDDDSTDNDTDQPQNNNDQSYERSDGGDNTSSTSAEINKIENDIFSILSPEQQNIRIFELKGNFAKTYDDIEDTLEKINMLNKTSQNQSVLERVVKSLNNMKDMIQFYITNTFDTKSYIENSTTYKKYLTALQVISNILKEVDSKSSKE